MNVRNVRRLLDAVGAMYAYCRVGHGYPCGRLYSLKAGICWAWSLR